MIYKDWLYVFLNTYKKVTLTDSSYKRLLYVVKFVPSYILDTELDLLNVFDLDNSLLKCSPRSAKYLRHLYKSSLHKAYCLGFLKYDISTKIRSVKYKAILSSSLTLNEIDNFKKAISGCKYEYLYLFLLYTGCRCSEALSLTFNDIDFSNNTVHIKGTKTVTSDRVVPMLPIVSSFLGVLKGASVHGAPNDRVFPFNSTNISHHFKNICPNHKLHDLRHTFITLCAQQGLNVKVVSKYVGHSDILTTYRIYTHVFSEFEKQEIERFKI